MKRISYLLLLIFAFGVFSVVKAETFKLSDIIAKFEADGLTVADKTDSSFMVNTGTETIQFSYAASDNTISYSAGIGKEVKDVVQSDRILGYIVDLSNNKAQYEAAKQANTQVSGVDYGTGCDILNMGFCYDSTSGKMQIAMSNQFTTFLYNYYTGTQPVSNLEPASNASLDPVVQDPETTPDSKNPDTGSFTEFGIIIALLILLLLVVNLKKRSETEFKI